MLSLLPFFLPLASAHIAAFAPGMYCRNGLPGENNYNTNLPVNPLYQLSKKDWWFQHDRGCDKAPPAPGEFLNIPAGGHFTVEHANNQAFTTLSYDGSEVSRWPDGAQHPEDWHGEWENGECMPGGGWMHATNHSNAQGTAFAIAYESDLSKIKMEDFVVFSVLRHTPWHRLATYQVPAGMPACPKGGCTCAHLWVPKNCGEPNMYMQGFKCKVTNAGTKKIAKAKPPVWCADNPGKCRKGAKQMIVFNREFEIFPLELG